MLNLRVSFINTVQYGAGVTHSFPYSLIISFRVPWQPKMTSHAFITPQSVLSKLKGTKTQADKPGCANYDR